MGDIERVRFKGIVFRRYPEAATQAERRYFTPGIADRQRGVKRLHEEVWIDEHGPIPACHHIHHIDLDPLNNAVENLQLLPAEVHRALHAAQRHESGWYVSDERLAHLGRIRPLAKEWHASDEGREWHRLHGIEVAAARTEVDRICEQCGQGYRTKARGFDRFCANKCKSQWRRLSGVDDIDKSCAACGAAFRANKYAKPKCCSRLCGQRYRNRQRASVQSDG